MNGIYTYFRSEGEKVRLWWDEPHTEKGISTAQLSTEIIALKDGLPIESPILAMVHGGKRD